LLAVGEHEFGSVDDQALRMSNGFCGGVGSTRAELCGALSAGVMIIGARYGRTAANEDDKQSVQTVAAFRQRFMDRFGSSTCQVLRDRYNDCPWLVEETSRVLIDLLAEQSSEGGRGADK
jgi:C_GCAxxG_C_C family probable redox protein